MKIKSNHKFLYQSLSEQNQYALHTDLTQSNRKFAQLLWIKYKVCVNKFNFEKVRAKLSQLFCSRWNLHIF